VAVAPTSHLENVVGVSGDWVSNANMIFSPQHPLIHQLMEAADKRFTGKGWNSIGDEMIIFDLKLVNIKYCFSGPVLVTDKLTSSCRIGQRYSELNISDSNQGHS